jgi:hypothetical protein
VIPLAGLLGALGWAFVIVVALVCLAVYLLIRLAGNAIDRDDDA